MKNSRAKDVLCQNPKSFTFFKQVSSPKTLSRQFPLLAALHKAMDGAIFGVLIAVVIMSGFSLHWRHLWIVAYRKLDMTRDLSNKLNESTAMLEDHILRSKKLPVSMVRTKSDNLIYLEHSNQLVKKTVDKKKSNVDSFLTRLREQVMIQGY